MVSKPSHEIWVDDELYLRTENYYEALDEYVECQEKFPTSEVKLVVGKNE